MAKHWGGIGAWAADAERAEAEEQEAAAMAASSVGESSQSFPSLKEAAAAKPKKKKPMSLSEFTTGNYVGPGGGRRDSSLESKGLTPDEMLYLPTGPKERTAEELEPGRLGGGFRSFGRPAPLGRSRDRSDDGDGSWGGGGGRRSFGGFNEERRGPPPKASDFDIPSRSDEVDNWTAAKKPVPFTPVESGRHDRYSSLGSGSSSRADEVNNWASGKKPLPARSVGFGSGFRDSTPDSDRWGRSGLLRDGDRERPRIVLDSPKGDTGGSVTEPGRTRPSPFGAARPREEVLAEKGLDWRKVDSEIDVRKTSRPTSSHSSRPSSAQSSRPGSPPAPAVESTTKSRPKVNPFGDAKPREVLLQEQGKDWRKMDLELEHRRSDRPETDEVKKLKEEINQLKKAMSTGAEVSVNGESAPVSAGESMSLREQITRKEEDLERLTRQLNDKVRFGQRASDRPGSGSGRPATRSSMPEESRSTEFMDRPRSRGLAGDVWTKSGEDRRAFQGSKEKGFLSSRDMDRSKSRERW